MILVLAFLIFGVATGVDSDAMPASEINSLNITQCYTLTSRLLNDSISKGQNNKFLAFEEKKKKEYLNKFFAVNIINCLHASKTAEFKSAAEKREDEKAMQLIFKSMKKELVANDELDINDEEKAILMRLDDALIMEHQTRLKKVDSKSIPKL